MSSTRSRRSAASSNVAAPPPPPTGPCLLHERLSAELVKTILELSIDAEDLAPYPHLLARPEAYVATDALMASRLAEKLRSESTGRGARKLGIDYSGCVEVKGQAVPPGPAISELLAETPRLRELILIEKYSQISGIMAACLLHLELQRLELDYNDDFAWRRFRTESFEQLPQAFSQRVTRMINGDPYLTRIVSKIPRRVSESRQPRHRSPRCMRPRRDRSSTRIGPGSVRHSHHLLQPPSCFQHCARLGADPHDTSSRPILHFERVHRLPRAHCHRPGGSQPRRFRMGTSERTIFAGYYAGITHLTGMPQLRVLETGSPSFRRMLEPDAVLAVPAVERLILNINSGPLLGLYGQVDRRSNRRLPVLPGVAGTQISRNQNRKDGMEQISLGQVGPGACSSASARTGSRSRL